MKILNKRNILGAFMVVFLYILGQVLINADIMDSYVLLNGVEPASVLPGAKYMVYISNKNLQSFVP